MKTYNVRTLTGENVEISEYDIKLMKVVKDKDKYTLHLTDKTIDVNKSVVKTLSFIYPYIKIVNI